MKRSLIAILVVVCLPLTTQAAVKSGDLDLAMSFNWSSEKGSNGSTDRSMIGLDTGIDYFVTNRISLGVALGYENSDQTTIESTATSYTLRAKYHILKNTPLVPYFGVMYRWYEVETKLGSTTTKSDDTALGGMIGARYELTQHNDVYVEYQYLDYGNNWPSDYSSANKVVIGLIHQIK